MFRKILLIVCLQGLALGAAAATVSSSGVTGLDVNGVLYDVSFQDGSCNTPGLNLCNPSSVFGSENTEALVMDAMSALQQALNADIPTSINGCSNVGSCSIRAGHSVRYGELNYAQISSYTFQISSDTIFVVFQAPSVSYKNGNTASTIGYPADTWAAFSKAPAAVPLPAAAYLFLSALAGLPMLRRYKRS